MNWFERWGFGALICVLMVTALGAVVWAAVADRARPHHGLDLTPAEVPVWDQYMAGCAAQYTTLRTVESCADDLIRVRRHRLRVSP
jgi:hypothetical protein